MDQVEPPARVLRADCAACVGLCCVALPFGRSRDFAFDKAAGEPCRHLGDGDACGIHARLRERGMVGCTVFDCHGAGQQVTQVVYAGRRTWRDGPDTAREMFAVFDVVRSLHEMLALLADAARWAPAAHQERLAVLRARLEAASAGAPDEVLEVDVDRQRAEVGELLRRVSAAVRAPGGAAMGGADLVGRDLRRVDLRDADLRGALLVGARLEGVDLSSADLLGADLRDARLAGADLTTALLLTQPQLDAARGDERTRVPTGFSRPAHWTARDGGR